jgi:hypothetical protein
MTIPYGRILGFLDWSRYFFFKTISQFQTYYFSENLVAPGMEPGSLDL